MYEILAGPMFYFSLAVFFVGLLVRAVLYVRGLSWKLERVAYRVHPKAGAKGAIRSIVAWLIPFGTHSWRSQPFMTVVFFLFHIGVIFVPLLLVAHNVLLKEKFGFSLFTMPQSLADALSWIVIVAGVLLVLRRIALPEVRILTTAYDYFILAISIAPFVTGLAARYGVSGYHGWLLAHMILGEALLILAPFTKLSHIVLFFMSRAQLGMDYGIKRGGMKPHNKGMAW